MTGQFAPAGDATEAGTDGPLSALDGPRLAAALDRLAARDPGLAAALARHGYPLPRRRAAGFATLLQIMVAQQVSTSSAAAIWRRLAAACGAAVTPAAFLALDDAACRRVGLSGRKVDYGRGLASAVLEQRLQLATLARLPDPEVVAAIASLRGFGHWSAEIYLLFALGRIDGWPAGDLALQIGMQRLRGLPARPDRPAMIALAEPWRPWRGAGALFLWHLYGATTLELAATPRSAR